MAYYHWVGGKPKFFPFEDDQHRGRYLVECKLSCCKNTPERSFQPEGYQSFLEYYADTQTRKFWFVVRDAEGNHLDDLSFDDACSLADSYNDEYAEWLREIEFNGNWDDYPLYFENDDIIFMR